LVLPLFSVLPVLLVGLTVAANSQKTLERQIGTGALDFAHLSLTRINEFLYTKFRAVNRWARGSQLRGKAGGDSSGRITEHLAHLASIHEGYHYLVARNPEGLVVAASDRTLIGGRLAEGPGFRRALAGQAGIQDVSFDAVADAYSVVISAPIMDEGGSGVIGVLSAAVKWRTIHEMIADLEVAGRKQTLANHLVLTNHDGQL